MNSGVQSQEDVNIPVLLKSMQIIKGIYHKAPGIQALDSIFCTCMICHVVIV